ncbi:MAG: DUF2092 domain-containing protein [Thermodesulfobacteriota bacterium]
MKELRQLQRVLLTALVVLLLLSSSGWSAGEGKAAAAPSTAAAKPETAAPDPAKILQQACDLLKSAQKFSFKAEVTDDRVYAGGKKLQFAFDLEAYVQRPDKVRINAAGDLENKQFFYNGKTITLYDKSHNSYAVMEAPGTIDAAMDKASKEYGLRVSLVDLAESNAYALMTKGVKHALYVGEGLVRGVRCHHLAFDKDHIQWQIWIEAGDKPLIRKLIITQKKLLASPQWMAYLADWNFSPQFSDSLFVFTPPGKATKTRFVSLKELAAQQAKPAPAAKKKPAPKKEKKKGE